MSRNAAMMVACFALGCPGRDPGATDTGSLVEEPEGAEGEEGEGEEGEGEEGEGEEGEGEGEASCAHPWFEGGMPGSIARAGSAIAAADLDADGNDDLVFLDARLASLSVAFGGPSGLSLPINVALALPGADVDGGQVTAFDVNRDGALDLAAGCGVALGVGDGTFEPGAARCSEGRGIVALGDLDGDGMVDALVADPTLRLVLATGPTAWTAQPAAWATIAEATGDDIDDLIVVETSRISVHVGGAIGTAPPIESAVPVILPDASGARIVDVAAFLVNGSRHLAIAVAGETSWDAWGVAHARGDQSGAFTLDEHPSIATATRLAAVQADDDPNQEVIALNEAAVLLDDAGAEGFSERALAGNRINAVAVLRPDAMGPRQLVVLGAFDARLRALDAPSGVYSFGKQYAPALVPSAAGGPIAVATEYGGQTVLSFREGVLAARIDVVGRTVGVPAVVWPAGASAPIAFVGTDGGVARVEGLETTTPSSLVAADLPGVRQIFAMDWDADGDDEVVAMTEQVTQPFDVDDAGQLSPQAPEAIAAFSVAVVGDLDGDGLLDLISPTLPISARLRAAPGTAVQFPEGAGPARAAADIDFDGRDELLMEGGVCEIDSGAAVCAPWAWGRAVPDGPFVSAQAPSGVTGVIGGDVSLMTVQWTSDDTSAMLRPPANAVFAPRGAQLLSGTSVTAAGVIGSPVPLTGAWGTHAGALPGPDDSTPSYGPRFGAQELWGDFDGDGAPDLATFDGRLGEMTLTTHPTEATHATVAMQSSLIAVMGQLSALRLEPSGPTRLVQLDADGGLLTVLALDGATPLAALQTLPVVADWLSLSVDSDEDGAVDLMLLGRSGAAQDALIPLAVVDGALELAAPELAIPVGASVALGDFDSDGSVDLATATNVAVTVKSDLVGLGGQVTFPIAKPRAYRPSLLRIRMGLGRADVLVATDSSETRRIDVVTGATTAMLSPPYAKDFFTPLDVDGDHDDDLLGVMGGLVVIENDDGNLHARELHGFFDVAAAMGDVDGDGDDDLLGSSGAVLRGRCPVGP